MMVVGLNIFYRYRQSKINDVFISIPLEDILLVLYFHCNIYNLQCVEYKPCWNYSACINTEPGFQCRRCPYGYLGTFEDGLSQNVSRRTFQLYNNVLDSVQYQTCVDVDECLISNGGCDTNSYCYNTIVSLFHMISIV